MATASGIMTREVVTVSQDTPVREVAELLASKRFGSVPVVDAEGHVLGIVQEEDLVTRAARIHLPRYIHFLGGYIFLENPQKFEEEAEKILAVNARNIMERNFATTNADTPVEDLAARMLDQDLRRILVLDANDCLIGIITRADIVRMQVTDERLPEEKE